MPTIMTHAVVGAAIMSAAPSLARPGPLALAVALAVLPDLDVVAVPLGVPWGSMWNHRGVSHSLFVALVLGLAAARLARHSVEAPWWKLALALTVVTASHGVLDAFTNGGIGIAFFAPFSAARYFFPWTPVEVSPLGLGILSRHGFDVLVSEAEWIVLPTVLTALAVRSLRRQRHSGAVAE